MPTILRKMIYTMLLLHYILNINNVLSESYVSFIVTMELKYRIKETLYNKLKLYLLATINAFSVQVSKYTNKCQT